MTKHTRSVFVIMPFERSPTRGKAQLDEFFECRIKGPIEASDDFTFMYKVRRSDQTFNISDQIIHDLYNADIVICDLSGEHANPNVMYELGVRLALSHSPVIMIREEHSDNKKIFDVSTYYTHPYSVAGDFAALEKHIKEKIKGFETGRETFRSPVLATLARDPAVVREIERQRVVSQLRGLRKSLNFILRASGGSLVAFIKDLGVSPMPPDEVISLLRYLIDNKGMLASLDWAKFRFRPSAPPQLHALLSDNRLEATCEAWVAELWAEIFGEYYGTFFGTDLFWSKPDYVSMASFVGQTHHLLFGVIGLIALVEGDNEGDQRPALCDMLQPLVRFAGLPSHLRDKVLEIVDRECGGP